MQDIPLETGTNLDTKGFGTGNSDRDVIHTSIDYCYWVMYGVSHGFKEAMESANSKHWNKTIDEEIPTFKENNTFTLTSLPKGKKTVGGDWVYSV